MLVKQTKGTQTHTHTHINMKLFPTFQNHSADILVITQIINKAATSTAQHSTAGGIANEDDDTDVAFNISTTKFVYNVCVCVCL